MAVSVTDFGAVGGNDDGAAATNDTAFANAIAARAADGGGIVWVPGRFCISQEIVVPPPVVLAGEDRGAHLIRQINPTANGVVFEQTSFAFANRGGGLRDLTIEAGSGFVSAQSFAQGSTGTGIVIRRGNPAFSMDRWGVHGFANGVKAIAGWYGKADNGEISMFSGDGLWIGRDSTSGDVGAGRMVSRMRISNNGFTGDKSNSVGIRLKASGGDFLNTIDITSCGRDYVVDPDEGDWVLYTFNHQVLADNALGDGFTFDGTLGKIWSIEMSQCWAAYNGGNGVVTKGSIANVDGLRAVGSRFRENGKHGWDHQGGSFIRLIGGEINSNGQAAANTYDGFHVAADVNNFSIDGVEIGNRASSLPDNQRSAVKIEAGSSFGWAIRNSDLRNNLTAALANGSTSTNFVAANNLI